MSPFELVLVPAVFMAGFGLGVVVGATWQGRALTREVGRQVSRSKAWLDTWGWYIVGVFLLFMSLLIYKSQRDSSTALTETQTQSTCLTAYANQLYDSLTPRQSASESLQNADETFNGAMVQLFRDALSKHPQMAKTRADVEAVARAARHKQNVSNRLSAERKDNPYPAPPKKVCHQ